MGPGYATSTMKRAYVPTIALVLVTACGGSNRNDCPIAKEKIEQCNAELAAILPVAGLSMRIDDDCSGWNECNASCVKDASCYGMRWALLGPVTDPNRMPPSDAGVITQCLLDCSDRFDKP